MKAIWRQCELFLGILLSVFALFYCSLGCRPETEKVVPAAEIKEDFASTATEEVAPMQAAKTSDAESKREGEAKKKPAPAGPLPVVPVKVGNTWPVWRGNSEATGFSTEKLMPPLKIGWEFALEEDAFDKSPVVAEGMVFLTSAQGLILALRLEDGKEVWRLPTEIGFNASASYYRGRIYVGDLDGRIFCIDPKKGEIVWKVETEESIEAAANFKDDRVIIPTTNGTLFCLNIKDGSEVWRFQNNDQLFCFPTIVGDRIVLGGCNKEIVVVDVNSGEKLDGIDIEEPTGSTVVVGGNIGFVGNEGGLVWAADYTTGEVIWQYQWPDRSYAFRSSAALDPFTVFVGSRDRQLHAIDRASGESAWTFRTKGRIDGSPIVVGEVVYFGTSDGRLYAVDAKKGEELWRFEIGGTVLGSPAFVKGRLIVATDDGQVFCFVETKEEKDGSP